MGSNGCPCSAHRCTHTRFGTSVPSMQTKRGMQGFGRKKASGGKKRR
jgi:hypothetical protein